MTASDGHSDPPAAAGRLGPSALRGLSFFAGLDQAAVAEAARIGRVRRARRGETLFYQDAEASSFYLLLQGRLKAVQTGSDGQRTVVRFLGPGEPAGVFALLGAGQRYPASAIVVVDSVLLSWEGAALRRLVQSHPGIALNAMKAMGDRVHDAHARLGQMAAERVERRLAHALLRLVRQAGRREPDGAVRIDFPISRQDIAEMTGTTLHTASRVLSGWEQAGILGEGGRQRIVVRNQRALMRIAED
ncbi:MAG: Crp/Fnr family transcriptional regulator [Acetobacteraceae bacterium]|nr:Crp/Fnr family transcriptional regulator [Acetobacteraceae bacterium]